MGKRLLNQQFLVSLVVGWVKEEKKLITVGWGTLIFGRLIISGLIHFKKKHWARFFPVAFFGGFKWPFQGLSELHLGDQKVTRKKLEKTTLGIV